MLRASWMVVLLVLAGIGACSVSDERDPRAHETAQVHDAAPEYAFVDGAATSHAQGLRAAVRDGALVVEAGLLRAELELALVGNEPPPAAEQARFEGNRARLARGHMEEWYVNGPRGIEQGFV